MDRFRFTVRTMPRGVPGNHGPSAGRVAKRMRCLCMTGGLRPVRSLAPLSRPIASGVRNPLAECEAPDPAVCEAQAASTGLRLFAHRESTTSMDTSSHRAGCPMHRLHEAARAGSTSTARRSAISASMAGACKGNRRRRPGLARTPAGGKGAMREHGVAEGRPNSNASAEHSRTTEGRCDFALHGISSPGREALLRHSADNSKRGAAALRPGLCEGGGAASIDRFVMTRF